MSDDTHPTSARSLLWSLQENGAYSDLKITCGSDTFNVHKNIICPQSDFFRAACRPDTFQEGKAGVIDIPAGRGRQASSLTQPITAEEFDWDLDVETVDTVKHMVNYFYNHEYSLEAPTGDAHYDFSPANLARGRLATHAAMYAMGEKYGVPGLKDFAMDTFEQRCCETTAGLSSALVIAFTGTPETDTGFRESVVRSLILYPPALRDEEVAKTIKDLPELVHRLYIELLERLQPLAR
ncbi:hypothetical protein E4T43_01049 [Aureobasidium subglaciale]|nr:hypothetical protein E4T43_01049 [Aureobasidium subglaciale]